MFSSIHPLILAAAVCAVIALAGIVIGWFVRGTTAKAVLFVLALIFLLPAGYVFLAFHPWLVDSRFRTYRAFYQDIKVGMTREQVLATLENRYPANGPRKPPTVMNDTAEALGFFMNPETSREPNCEGIFLTLERGRVIKKVYSPD
jgi:Zn-dependent protease with chaperone function